MPINKNSISYPVSKPPGTAEFAFVALLDTMQTLCNVERDIVGMDAGDPAFDSWFREAEAARTAAVDAAATVVLAHTITADDRRFRSVARSFEAMLLTQDAAAYAFVSAALTSPWLYHVAGRGPRAARSTALLRRFRYYLELLQTCPDYAPELGAVTATMAA